MRDITFPTYGKMLNTVSRINLMWTEERINLNILIILNPRITVVAEEKVELTLSTFIRIPRSVAKTMSISNLFHTFLKYAFPSAINFITISKLNINANTVFACSENSVSYLLYP